VLGLPVARLRRRFSPKDNMELKFSPLSPYVRKVSVTAHELGIAQRIRLTPVKTREEPDKIAPFNPLGKIPTLVTDSGAVLYDSPVICEYLDAEFGNHRLLPASGARRWDILTRVALADGTIDAAILVRQERLRAAEKQAQDWIDWQLRKVYAGLDQMERSVETFGESLDLGQIALACALGYMPLRLAELEGLPKWPRLKAWYDVLAQRESFRLTTPVL
jgi:glutathione S-transferase